MALPRRTTGSLDPTFVPARPVCLAVNPAYALALHGGFPIQDTNRCPFGHHGGSPRPKKRHRCAFEQIRSTFRVAAFMLSLRTDLAGEKTVVSIIEIVT